MLTKISLNGSDWLFKGYYGEDWRWRLAMQPGSRDYIRGWKAAVVPGCVLNDLWQNGDIADPHFECNSLLSEWACQRTWLYRKTFRAEAGLEGQRVRLVFRGVDYQMEVFLNGESLGTHTGMYTPAIFEVSGQLRYSEENLLVVVVAQAPQEQPQVSRSNLVRTHKARMNYWWDFCPRLVHQGIWDEVYLEASGRALLEDVYIRPVLSQGYELAEVRVTCRVNSIGAGKGQIEVRLSLGGDDVAHCRVSCAITEGESQHNLTLTMFQPKLLWPNGMGEQVLYQADVDLRIATKREITLSDRQTVKFGVRQVRAVQNEGAPSNALPYTLEVNSECIYAKGWNWVPMDALYGVEREEKLTRLLRLARQANVNLLRVWGGGLIEKEAFYYLCDRYGLLVWQEFIQSSSGIDNNPPENADFIAFMSAEARQIIPARRNHPSLAIWCGGNELSRNDKPLDDSHPMLSALKEVVREEAPDCIWLPTSSSGPVFGNSLEDIEKDPEALHDVHGPWEYQGIEKQYKLYNQGSSLFHSEFGVEGITNMRSLERSIAPEHRFPVDRGNPAWFHLGAWWVKEAMWRSMFGEFATLEQAVQATQFTQFEGLRYAVEADRRRWPHNSGSIPWQFNEPFPMAACTSAVDYYGEPKPVYYSVRAAYQPIHITASYTRLAWAGEKRFSADLWVACERFRQALEGELAWKLQEMNGAVLLEGSTPIQLNGEKSGLITTVSFELAGIKSPLFFLTLILTDGKGDPLGYNRYMFATGANLAGIFDLPKADVDFQIQQDNKSKLLTVHNPGAQTAFFVWLESIRDLSRDDYVYFANNYFCLLPGESQTIEAWFSGKQTAIRVSGWNIDTKEIE